MGHTTVTPGIDKGSETGCACVYSCVSGTCLGTHVNRRVQGLQPAQAVALLLQGLVQHKLPAILLRRPQKGSVLRVIRQIKDPWEDQKVIFGCS